MVKLGLDKLAKLFKEKGKTQGERILKFIKKQDKLAEALGSNVGSEILEESIVRLSYLLALISDNKASDDEKAEYRALQGIVDRWAAKIIHLNKILEEIRR